MSFERPTQLARCRCLRLCWPSTALAALAMLSVPAWSQAADAGAQRDNIAGGTATGERFEELMRLGIELRHQGKDALAVERFNEALALRPASPRVRVHLGAAHHALGDWLSADGFLREALGSRGDSYVDRHRADLERELDVVAGHLGGLTVVTEVAGAQVRLNGRLVGTLPLDQPIKVAVGSYRMEVGKPGYLPAVRDVSIAPRLQSRVAVELEPSGGDRRPLWAPRWVPWALGGLGAVGALTASAAFYEREKYAKRWNNCSDTNPNGTRTREQLCSSDRTSARRAESVLLWSGGVSTVLLAGAVATGLIRKSDPSEEAEVRVACGLGIGTLVCAGHF